MTEWLVFFKESVELTVMWDSLMPEAAKIDKCRVSLKKPNQGRDGIKTFQGANKKSAKQSVLTSAISTDTVVEFIDMGQV